MFSFNVFAPHSLHHYDLHCMFDLRYLCNQPLPTDDVTSALVVRPWMSLCQDLCRSFSTEGHANFVAGVPVAMPHPSKDGHFFLLTFGHRAEALYRCHARSPDNPLIQASIRAGFPVQCMLVYPRAIHIIFASLTTTIVDLGFCAARLVCMLFDTCQRNLTRCKSITSFPMHSA